jgi:tRNA-splicing endonuclease subunit Sen34
MLLREHIILTQCAPFVFAEVAVLIDDPRAHPEPTLEQLKQWNAEQEQAIKYQVASTEAKGVKESARPGRAMSEEALQKRRLREERRLAEGTKAVEAAVASDGATALFTPEPISNPVKTSQPSISAADAQATKLNSMPHTVVIPAASSSLEWYDPNAVSYTAIAAAKDAGVWDYPSDLQERAKCGVFRSLWEQGYFMGGGIKFGGDYLVYPGS